MSEIDQFRLETKMIGPLPIVNHFTKRIGLDDILVRYLNTANTRKITYSQSIGVLLRISPPGIRVVKCLSKVR